MILLFQLQSKAKQNEREISTLTVKSREFEKQLESLQKKTNLLEQSVFMQEVRRSDKMNDREKDRQA